VSVDPSLLDHKAWLGYLQPDGLVVSPAALVDSQALLPRDSAPLQQRFLGWTEEIEIEGGETVLTIRDAGAFVQGFLEWPVDCLHGLDEARPLPDTLQVAIPELGETLAPSFAFRDPKPKNPDHPWLLLVQILPENTDLDAAHTGTEAGWSASVTRRFERLLREVQVPTGLLSNGTQFRLVYAPRGENSGNITFPVSAMGEVSGRPILAAFDLLLNRYRLIAAPSEAKLSALLTKSREYQSRVSAALAQQVLDALYELLRGFQAANDRMKGELLREVISKDPDSVYSALLNVLLRLVFLLYAEDRGVMPGSSVYVGNYSVHGLFERLREDAERYPDTMDHRFGAWAQLLAVFRAVCEGCKHPQFAVPARKGYLFDPQRFPFLEGTTEGKEIPLVADGVIYRVLEKLLLLDGERLSYRTLDVEEIGSVYQTIMGFGVEVVAGTAIALKGKRKHGGVPAAPVISLDALLAAKPSERVKWLKEGADTDLTGEAEKGLKAAGSVEDLLGALDKRIDRGATPGPVPRGGLVLQPTDERRRSGSHYTPRSFTEPIVRKTLEPILNRLGRHPKAEEILALKVCDIAVGSGAFLVETCRQLADELISSWHFHHQVPVIPPDEDEILFARRLVAQCCLYGVDRNLMAVDLAKLSLWLATLAKDHPFTFLDHAIRCGDSLVGLTRKQIETFTWKTEFTTSQLWEQEVRKRTAAALHERQNLLGLGDDYGTPQLKREKLEKADGLLDIVRFIGDTTVAAFFAADKDKAREGKRVELAERISSYLGGDLEQRPPDELKALRSGQFPITPFHWEIEFPEVFDRENPGFDVIVGNPPFAGKNTLLAGNREGYFDWLKTLHVESHGVADLVAHFYRSAFNLLRGYGCFGLIASNTIAQGDTRATGLRWICTHGGSIFAARKRATWPGQAAVVVSVVHVCKGDLKGPFVLDGREVQIITAYLFHSGGNESPTSLRANECGSFIGSYVLGMGFTFDDSDTKGTANPLALMRELIAKDPRNAERVFPYLGGEEVNDDPEHSHRRYVINFADFPLRRAELDKSWQAADDHQREQWERIGIVPLDYPLPVAADWPDLLNVVEQKVKPERLKQGDKIGQQRWWRFLRTRGEMLAVTAKLNRVVARSRIGNAFAFTLLPARIVLNEKIVVFPFEGGGPFAVIQSRVHEVWAVFFSSTLKDDLQYTPSECFETFPFPVGFETNAALKTKGREYYEFRAALMKDLWLGLTEIYNLFHSPDDEALARLEALYRKRAANSDWRTAEGVPANCSPLQVYATPTAALAGVLRLRELHAAMDAAVLTAYGWTDLVSKCTCEFLLEFEEETESGAEESSGRKKKKPWRHRWPDEVRDEVLARLLKLNAERGTEERLSGGAATSTAGKPKKGGSKGGKSAARLTAGDLLDL